MAIKITEECINCGACEPECPNNAIYEGGSGMGNRRRNNSKGSYTQHGWHHCRRRKKNAPVAADIYYITPNKCTECQVFMKNPSAAVCPVDCCVAG